MLSLNQTHSGEPQQATSENISDFAEHVGLNPHTRCLFRDGSSARALFAVARAWRACSRALCAFLPCSAIFFRAAHFCFCLVVFCALVVLSLLVSSRLQPRAPSAHLALRTPRASSGAFRVFFSFALRFYQRAQKKSPCLMGVCSARRHSPSPVCPLALRPLRPMSHVLSAPFQCGLRFCAPFVLPACCVCKECVCWPCTISHDVFLFFSFLSSILSHALRHRISILACQRVCVRARSFAAQVRRRSDQERAILSRPEHAARQPSRTPRAPTQVKGFFHQTQVQVRRLRSSAA